MHSDLAGPTCSHERLGTTGLHIHIHTYIYIYMYIYNVYYIFAAHTYIVDRLMDRQIDK